MAVACVKWKITLPNIVIRHWSASPLTCKMELFVTITYNWKPLTTVAKSSVLDDSRRLNPTIVNMILWLALRAVSLMNSFWIELDGFFVKKIIFAKSGTLPTSKMKLFVTVVDSWKLLTTIAISLDPPWPNYDFQRTEEGCSNVASLVAFADNGRLLFVFIPNPKCN